MDTPFTEQRYFNTSGPNNPAEHYTLPREALIQKGLRLVKKDRYFTIRAPRQTGKSTYFQLLSRELQQAGYLVAQVNLENYLQTSLEDFFNYILRVINQAWQINLQLKSFAAFQNELAALQDNKRKFVFIIDEVEGLNPEIFGQFLHSIRNLYHFRSEHCLKSVILVGVSNIVGIVEDHASPFNIADNLSVDYFSREEVFSLLQQHETESGQLFAPDVKEKILSITAGQPGLVNGFAYQLVEKNPDKKIIAFPEYLQVEDWYLTEAIDKNVANIINKAQLYRPFVEGLLYLDQTIPFNINREAIRFLQTIGLIKKAADGNIEFRVPLYKKRLYQAFYPYLNGEKQEIIRSLYIPSFVKPADGVDFYKLITHYKNYIKRRSFKYFREKDAKTGQYKSIKEAALVYSFETFIQAFLQEAEGKSYLEAHTGAGRSDLIINLESREYVIEVKIYASPRQFAKGKKQLAYYCRSLSLQEGIYLVFIPDQVNLDQVKIKEGTETVAGVKISSFLVFYNEERDF